MRALVSLFGKSPFSPLQKHMEKVTDCVEKLGELFAILPRQNQDAIDTLVKRISTLEHKADLAKNDIRDNLSTSLFLPVDRKHLLEALSLQDSIADIAEDVAILVSLKPVSFLDDFQDVFAPFLAKNFETFQGARRIVNELDELLETSFGGVEAEKVRAMVDDVAYKEHETDLLQRELLKRILNMEKELSIPNFFQWMKIIETVGMLSNLSENLAYKIRSMLEKS